MEAARFEVLSTAVDYDSDLDLDQLVGGVYSALGVTRLPPPDQRPAFAEQVRAALAPHDHFSEHVHVAILTGHVFSCDRAGAENGGRPRGEKREAITWLS